MSPCVCGHSEDDHENGIGECDECDCDGYEPDHDAGKSEPEVVFD